MSAQIRLEALRLSLAVRGVTNPDDILNTAREFEEFLRGDEQVVVRLKVAQDAARKLAQRGTEKGRRK